jgi:hypothetical protein
MEQLLLHLVGDYITQTNWMARMKTHRIFPAFVHAVVYSLPFLLLIPVGVAWMTILLSHFVIDHFRLARHVTFWKNKITEPDLKWEDCNETGFPKAMPAYMSFWLMIIVDNTLHLCINYAAIRWL